MHKVHLYTGKQGTFHKLKTTFNNGEIKIKVKKSTNKSVYKNGYFDIKNINGKILDGILLPLNENFDIEFQVLLGKIRISSTKKIDGQGREKLKKNNGYIKFVYKILDGKSQYNDWLWCVDNMVKNVDEKDEDIFVDTICSGVIKKDGTIEATSTEFEVN